MRNLIYTVLSIVIINGCAKRGSPSGGPVDSIAPVLINASPKLNSINFDSEEIKLTFDEFVKLDKVEDQLIISPPLEKTSYEVKPLSGVTKKVFLTKSYGHIGFSGFQKQCKIDIFIRENLISQKHPEDNF